MKITPHFELEEFIHPAIFKRFKGNSKLYLSQTLVNLVENIRVAYGGPIWINTWHRDGHLINSGVRDYDNPMNGRLNKSRHYYGLCADLHTNDIKKLQDFVFNDRMNWHLEGLRVIEDYKYTPSWLHLSVEWTGLDHVKIIKP